MARNLLQRRVILGILETVRLHGKAIVRNVGVRTGKGSVAYIDGFLGQMKGGSE
jgi:hypothetical protein